MAIDERRRSELFRAASEVFGEEPAATMFELLPPAGVDVATKDDIARLETRLDGRIDGLEQRIDDRFEAQRREMDARFDAFDARLDRLRDEVVATFRGELVAAVSGQTRAIIVAVATAMFGLSGLALSLAQLS